MKKRVNFCDRNLLKRIFAGVLSVVIALPILLPEQVLLAEENDVGHGDLNSDGKINILDIISLKSCIVESNTAGISLKAADLDGDNDISSCDVKELTRYFLNQSKTFSYSWDLDEDNLTNAEEYTLGTNIALADSDQDGLNDYDEVNVYKTNPLLSDTDKDGILDSDELKLGLNPLKSMTDGKTLDKNRTFKQTIDFENQYVSDINNGVNFQISVEADMSGCIENSLLIKESGYSKSIDYEAITGKIVDVSLDNDKVLGNNGLKISFKMSNKNVEDYMVFKYFDNLNMIYPLPTSYDKKNSILYCIDNSDGTYCVAEKEKWIDLVSDSSSLKRSSNKSDETLFLMCLDSLFYNTNKNSEDAVRKVSKKLFELNNTKGYQLSEEFGMFSYNGALSRSETISSYDLFDKTNFYSYDELEYFLDINDISMLTLYLTTSSTGSHMLAPIKMAYNSSKHSEYNEIYVFSLASSKYEKRDYYSDSEQAEMSSIRGLHGSYIIPSSSSDDVKNYYQSLADKYHGKVFLFDGDSSALSDSIYKYVDSSIAHNNTNVSYINYAGLFDPSWKDNRDENIPDSDGDDLSDADEINWNVYKANNTYSDYADENYTGSDKTVDGLNQLCEGREITTKVFIPFISNPMEEDTDNDGISDGEELSIGTDPKNSDTDSDKLDDGLECSLLFNPLDPNPDGDSYNDYQEYTNGTDPFIYDLTPEERAGQFTEGILKGDIIKEPTVTQLLGQIVGGIIPYAGMAADIRDAITNVAYGQWFNAACSAIGIVPALGDTVKSSSKVVKFISKNADKTDEIADLLMSISKKFPDNFSKLVPNSSLDEIADAFKSNNTMSRSTYLEITGIFKKAGKKLWTLSDDFPNAKIVTADEDVWGIPGWFERGNAIDKLLGNNLGETYKTYDRYVETTNTAISIKSIDPMLTSYRSPSYFKRQLEKYANSVIKGADEVVYKGEPQIDIQKGLELAFPDVPLTRDQKKVLDNFIETYSDKIEIIITIVN